ncbi:MAG: penicillin-binding protein activator LpoB [Treponemataceae bacterium]|nr:penicillin-binding protein activator LpoB [Treponemataceae bacterium]
MKKTIFIAIFLLALLSVTFAKRIKRVNLEDATAKTAFWTPQDMQVAADALVRLCIEDEIVDIAIEKYQNEHDGLRPAAQIGKIQNKSSESIKTSQMANALRSSIRSSGVLDFVVSTSGSEGAALRDGRLEQTDAFSEVSDETKLKQMSVRGAAFEFNGSIDSAVALDNRGKHGMRTYFVYLAMHDRSTNEIIWDHQYETTIEF